MAKATKSVKTESETVSGRARWDGGPSQAGEQLANLAGAALDVVDPVKEVAAEVTPEVPADRCIVELELPVAERVAGYATRHVDMRLNQRRADALNRLFMALRGESLPMGVSQAERVDSPARALMYVLDRITLASDGGGTA